MTMELFRASGGATRVFILTWLSYASYYLTRKNFAVAKVPLEKTFAVSRAKLGNMDMLYSAGYASGQFIWGTVTDLMGPRRLLALGMLATAAISISFGSSSLPIVFIMLWALNGTAQATGWSSNIKAMTPWFPQERRGRVMGFWTTCFIIGSLVSTPLAGTLRHFFSWRAAFIFPAFFVAFVGMIIFLALPEKRSTFSSGDTQAKMQDRAEYRKARNQLLRTPLLWSLGSAYFVLKLVRYLFWNWSPYFMEKELRYSAWLASIASQIFDVGGVIGAVLVGWASDRFLGGRRVPVVVCSIIILGILMPCYAWAAPRGLWLNMFVLFFIGFFLFGPDALISAAASQDLGGSMASSIAAGIINGTGSVGQMFSGPIIRFTHGSDWSTLYLILGCAAIVTAMVLVPFWSSRREMSTNA